MAGPLDSPVDEGAGAIAPQAAGPEAPHTGFIANAVAGYDAARAGAHSTRNGQNAFEARYYDQIVGALTAEGKQGSDLLEVRPGGIGYRGPANLPVNAYGVGQLPVPRSFRNPYSGSPTLGQDDNPLLRLYGQGDQREKQAIFDAIREVQKTKPNFLKGLSSPEEVAARADTDRKGRVAQADAVTSQAGTMGKIGGFIGGMVGSIASGDPENAVGMGMETAAGKTVARTIIKRGITEGAVNAGAGAAALPGVATDTRRLGGEMSTDDMATSVEDQFALGGVLGAAHASAPHVAAGIGQAVSTVAGKVAENLPPVIRDPLAAAAMRAGTIPARADVAEWRRLHSPYGVHDTATPDEKAAAHVVERDADIREASPLHPEADANNDHRLDAVAASLGVDLHPPQVPTPAPMAVPTVPDRTAGASMPRRPASFTEALGHAEGTGQNPHSSADGHFQFTQGTWLGDAKHPGYVQRVADTTGMSREQILALRHDLPTATKAEALFRQDNARYLRGKGLEDSPGNLSLAHFLGAPDAAKVLRADPNTPLKGLVDDKSYAANAHGPKDVFNKNQTAGDLVAWANKRIGTTIDHPAARGDAVAAFDPIDDRPNYAETPPYSLQNFKPDDLHVDAGIMQYKSGGDASGVTDALKGVDSWNPLLAGQVLVWEGADGRHVVVDGHQRTGLAKRLSGDDPSIEMPAVVIREADGISARDARVYGALRNISNGTGSIIDNARVLRDAPSGGDILPPNARNMREIGGLVALSHEAFGAVLNDVVDPHLAAEVGIHAAGRPETHVPLIDLLHKTKVSKQSEAQTIVRQALADGFGSASNEHQMSMFGETPAQSLYVPIARILDASRRQLGEEKRTFKVLSDKAGRIEGAGKNKLDRKANAGKVLSSEEAIAILNATANSHGPVRDALIAAARAELSGSRRADAVKGFLDALSGIDLHAAARGVEQGDALRGSPVEAGGQDHAAQTDSELSGSDGPSLFEQAVSAKEQSAPFSDPQGEGAKRQVDLLEHDLKAEADPNQADRQKQETALKAASPLQSVAEEQGTMGLGLFDVADQPTFRLSEEGDAAPLAKIMADSEADTLAAQAARDCLL